MSEADSLRPRSAAGSPAARGKAPRIVRFGKILFLGLLLAWFALVFWNSAKPLPPGTHVVSQTSRLSEADVEFLFESPELPNILAREMSVIDHAEQLIVVDASPLAPEPARHLLARKRARPNLKVVVVTDPRNEAFGGTPAQTLSSLEEAGIIVARVRLERLRDSNPLYSGLWRLLIGWWNDPFDEIPGRVTPLAWLRMQNSKADQRQLMVADDGSGGWTSVITASDIRSGLILRGPLARTIVASELQIAAWSTEDDRLPPAPPMGARGVGSIDVRFMSEGAIAGALLDAIAAAGRDDRISVAVDNLADRRLIGAALRAAARGARLQILLARNPGPNRAVAGELLRDGGGRIEVRWSPIEPKSARPRLLIVQHRDDLWVDWGSANFTRRNLGDLNLEADVELRMPARSAPARAFRGYFAKAWSTAGDAADFAQESAAEYWRYRLTEAAGLSSF
jgi:hypothetical protein